MASQRSRKPFFVILLLAFLFQFGSLIPCFAQAWMAPKGTGAISLNYQFVQVDNHIFGQGQRIDSGQIFGNTVLGDFSYSFTDKLSASVSLPFVSSKYSGKFPHRILNPDGSFTIPLDDGSFHSTFQDFGFQVRYNIATNPMQITPYVRTMFPSHDYGFFAHAAPGIRSKRLQFGTYIGAVLDPLLPNTYIDGRYSYTFRGEFFVFPQITAALIYPLDIL